MKNARRLIFTICSMCFAVCIIIAGVLATTSANFTIKTGASFTATGATLNTIVYIEGYNAYNSIYIENSNFVVHNGSDIDVQIADQTFNGIGAENKIKLDIQLRNDGGENVRVSFDEIPGTSSMSVIYTYWAENSYSLEYESSSNNQSRAVIYPDECMNMTIEFILNDENAINIPMNFELTLTETSDDRNSSSSIPSEGLYLANYKSDYSVGETIENADITLYYNGAQVTEFSIFPPDMSVAGSGLEVRIEYTDPETSNVESVSYTINVLDSIAQPLYNLSINNKEITIDDSSLNGGQNVHLFLTEEEMASNQIEQNYILATGYVAKISSIYDDVNQLYPYGLSYIQHASTSNDEGEGRYTFSVSDYYTYEALNQDGLKFRVAICNESDTEITILNIVVKATPNYLNSINLNYIDSNGTAGSEMLTWNADTSQVKYLVNSDLYLDLRNDQAGIQFGCDEYGYFMGGPTAREVDFEGLIEGDNTKHNKQVLYTGFTSEDPKLLTGIDIDLKDGYSAILMNYDKVFDISQLTSGYNYIQVYIKDSTNIIIDSFELEILMPSYIIGEALATVPKPGMSGLVYPFDSAYASLIETNDGSVLGLDYLYNSAFYGSAITVEIYDSTQTNQLTSFSGIQDFHNIYYVRYTYESYVYNAKVDLYSDPYINSTSSVIPAINAIGFTMDYDTGNPRAYSKDEIRSPLFMDSYNHKIKFVVNSNKFTNLSEYVTYLNETIVPSYNGPSLDVTDRFTNTTLSISAYDSAKTYAFEILSDTLLRYTISDNGSVEYEERIIVEYADSNDNADIRRVLNKSEYKYNIEDVTLTLDTNDNTYKNDIIITLYNNYIFPFTAKDPRALMTIDANTNSYLASMWPEYYYRQDNGQFEEGETLYMISNAPSGSLTFYFSITSSDGTVTKNYAITATIKNVTDEDFEPDITVSMGALSVPFIIKGYYDFTSGDEMPNVDYPSYSIIARDMIFITELEGTAELLGYADTENYTFTMNISLGSNIYSADKVLINGESLSSEGTMVVPFQLDLDSNPGYAIATIDILCLFTDNTRIPTFIVNTGEPEYLKCYFSGVRLIVTVPLS